MNKKGFTLIELLAVIIILAIIALIAAPIVLDIIDDSKKSTTLIRGKMYLEEIDLAMKNSRLEGKKVSDGTYKILENGNICLKEENNKCEESLEVETKGEVPSSGTITIINGQISGVGIVINDETIVKDSKGELIYYDETKIKTIDDICVLASDSIVTGLNAGAKYICQVKPGVNYTFYVLTTPTTTDEYVNLIMDRNICSDGTPTDANKEDKCLVAWNSSGSNTGGPVTAMTYLYNATKSWTNIPPLNYEYKDREYQGITTNDIGYTSFKSTNGVAIITTVDGTTLDPIGSKEEPLRSRMPIHIDNTTNSSKNEVADFNNSNGYLYENLNGGYWDYSEETKPTNNISDIYGYWTLSSHAGYSNFAWYVTSDGSVFRNYVDFDDNCGARPVISLKI